MAGFEDGGRGHEPGAVGDLWELAQVRKQSVPETAEGNSTLLTP